MNARGRFSRLLQGCRASISRFGADRARPDVKSRIGAGCRNRFALRSAEDSDGRGGVRGWRPSPLRIGLFLGIFALGAIGVAAQSGDYDIPWRTIDNGGGLAYGDTGYILEATIGQPESEDLIGGPYRVQGGYWSELVTPLPRASATPSASPTASATVEVTPDPNLTPTVTATSAASATPTPTATLVSTVTPAWRQINIPFLVQKVGIR